MSVSCLKDGRWVCRYVDKATKKGKFEYFGRGLAAEKAAYDYDESLGLRPWKRRTPERGSAFFRDIVKEYMVAKAGLIEESTLFNFGINIEW